MADCRTWPTWGGGGVCVSVCTRKSASGARVARNRASGAARRVAAGAARVNEDTRRGRDTGKSTLAVPFRVCARPPRSSVLRFCFFFLFFFVVARLAGGVRSSHRRAPAMWLCARWFLALLCLRCVAGEQCWRSMARRACAQTPTRTAQFSAAPHSAPRRRATVCVFGLLPKSNNAAQRVQNSTIAAGTASARPTAFFACATARFVASRALSVRCGAPSSSSAFFKMH